MNVTFIGAGVMGGSLITRARALPGVNVSVVEKHAPRAEEIAASGIPVGEVADLVPSADVVVLAVKPQDMAHTLEQIAPALRPGALVVSIAAGVPIARIAEVVGPDVTVVRVMPNTPAQIGLGLLGVSTDDERGDAGLSDEERNRILHLLQPAGELVFIPESLQDALTAVSGSGPAYLFYLAEAMEAAAIDLGLDPQTARVMVQRTLMGASALYAQSSEHPQELRHKVTSPGGTTAAAINSLDESLVRESFIKAIGAARERSRELSQS